jgi:hypothetical protein
VPLTGFLLDEHVPISLREQLRSALPTAFVRAIGDDQAPPKGTPDPQILRWIELHNCTLITNNRRSMPVHPATRLAEGHHVPGVIQLPEVLVGIGRIREDLTLIWGASLPGEYQDQIVYLSLRR